MSKFCWKIIFFSILCMKGMTASERPNVIVFYTDDHGYADLSCQGVLEDIKTPHVDAIAKRGVRALHGYSSAPQCVPSRGGLLVGRFQSKFGLESNHDSLAGFNAEETIAERLSKVGYKTAQFGKWHLGERSKITDHGFQHVFAQNNNASYFANIDLEGNDIPGGQQKDQDYHVLACSRAAASLVHRYRDEPFFFYIAYRAPHVPLDAPQSYLDRFPGDMPERRRQALAMLSAVDDGVGMVMKALEETQLTEKTMVFYMGDNGAPLKIHKLDAPGGGPGWDGSLNTPLNGEKGMLAEGGIHVPYVMAYPAKVPAGLVYEHPITSLDVASTIYGELGLDVNPEKLDGVNLLPYLSGEKKGVPHEYLMWRWLAQTSIRKGDWKYYRGADREYLYNLKEDLEEKNNLLAQYPELAKELKDKLEEWDHSLMPLSAEQRQLSETWTSYFDFYLDGKQVDYKFKKGPSRKKKK